MHQLWMNFGSLSFVLVVSLAGCCSTITCKRSAKEAEPRLLGGQKPEPSSGSTQNFHTLGMDTRCWVNVLLTLSITPFQCLPFSHPGTHSERGSYITCHILWHSTSLEKDPWLLIETRCPCGGYGKEMGLHVLTVSSIWHLKSDQLSASEKHAKQKRNVQC